jgi:transcription elongation factor Elf1
MKSKKPKSPNKKKDRTLMIRDWFSDYKSNLECTKCGESHPACLTFHHTGDEEKTDDVSAMVGRGYAIERIQEEIDKCIVLCANCHNKLHYELRNGVWPSG